MDKIKDRNDSYGFYMVKHSLRNRSSIGRLEMHDQIYLMNLFQEIYLFLAIVIQTKIVLLEAVVTGCEILIN